MHALVVVVAVAGAVAVAVGVCAWHGDVIPLPLCSLNDWPSVGPLLRGGGGEGSSSGDGLSWCGQGTQEGEQVEERGQEGRGTRCNSEERERMQRRAFRRLRHVHQSEWDVLFVWPAGDDEEGVVAGLFGLATPQDTLCEEKNERMLRWRMSVGSHLVRSCYISNIRRNKNIYFGG